MASQPTPEGVTGQPIRPAHCGDNRQRVRVRIEGVVQGVGFRPYVYRLASSLGLGGWVRNTSGNVRIEAEGPDGRVQEFLQRLPSEAPPLAQVHDLAVDSAEPLGATRFEILDSVADQGGSHLVSPDVATCDLCLTDLLERGNRRFHYPFTNCTNCGPRFTIITAMPYDRPNTTMASFEMCAACRQEYHDPANRRFHAQPNACPECGPALTLLDYGGYEMPCAEPLVETARLLREGKIVAIKGLGGFQLACDATAPQAVIELRRRKHRPAKPFAIMVRDTNAARLHCELTPEEESLLGSPSAPIVLARQRATSTVCAAVAPGLSFLGLMLPYTPLHHLLLRLLDAPLVMTSGNLSEEPIAAENDEAVTRLKGIADNYLVHNRPINSRYDDSVAMVLGDTVHLLRRARGYAPFPVRLPCNVPPVLAVGPQMKNTFCLAEGDRAFVSQHIGDLDSAETLEHFERTVTLYRSLFDIEPRIVAHDLHPDYVSTRYAQHLASSDIPTRPVQHHHAHIVSCIVENGVTEPVIGVAYDGSGYGTDGRIWGGEFLLCDANGSRRLGHLEYLPLPGGDAAILRPYRIAAAYVTCLIASRALPRDGSIAHAMADGEWRTLLRQIETGFNTPFSSSMGRLFDAVAALTGIRNEIDYDGQAAVELEMQAHRYAGAPASRRYDFQLDTSQGDYVVRLAGLFEAILADMKRNEPVPLIAAAFHDAVVQMTVDVCTRIRTDTGVSTVALSGGVFQNRILASLVPEHLHQAGFRVLLHRYLPANDGCVSLGQAVVAAQCGLSSATSK
jgi:hydrogenase maturation protein HypF